MRQRDRVSVRIGHVRDALAPRHVGRLPEHGHAAGSQLVDEPVEIVDVDEELEADAVADREAVLLVRPPGSDDCDLVGAAAESDVPRLALGRELEVPLEAEALVERRGGGYVGREDDREGAFCD